MNHPVSLEQLKRLFAGQPWLSHLELVASNVEPLKAAPQLFEGGLHQSGTGVVTFGMSPWVAVIHGDLSTQGDVELCTGDYEVSLTVVMGNVTARNLLFAKGAIVVVLGDVTLTGDVCGWYGDEGGQLEIAGGLTARAVFVEAGTPVTVGGALTALVCAQSDLRSPADFDLNDGGLFVPGAFFGERIAVNAIAELIRDGRNPFVSRVTGFR